MMIAYIPKEITTWENYEKYQEICDHFITVSNILGTRLKSERSISELRNDESEETKTISQIMMRIVMQCHDFIIQQQEETKAVAASAVQTYEKILVENNFNESKCLYIEQRIQELRNNM
jgi:hypothetical protein